MVTDSVDAMLIYIANVRSPEWSLATGYIFTFLSNHYNILNLLYAFQGVASSLWE